MSRHVMSCPKLNPTMAIRFRDIVCYSRFDQHSAGVVVPSQFGSIDTGLQRGRNGSRPVCQVVSSDSADPQKIVMDAFELLTADTPDRQRSFPKLRRVCQMRGGCQCSRPYFSWNRVVNTMIELSCGGFARLPTGTCVELIAEYLGPVGFIGLALRLIKPSRVDKDILTLRLLFVQRAPVHVAVNEARFMRVTWLPAVFQNFRIS